MEWVPSRWAAGGLGNGRVLCAGDADEPQGWDVSARSPMLGLGGVCARQPLRAKAEKE